MNKPSLLTVMVQAETPERIKQLIDLSRPAGAEAFGMQFCRLKPEYKTEDIYRQLFSYAPQPTYATNYRLGYNEGKTDDQIAEELLTIAECGADICDVLGDLFDPHQPDEMTEKHDAIQKQIELVKQLHAKGSKVIISAHVLKFTPYERVLEIAREQQSRGADICKIVTWADTMEQQFENMKMIDRLKQDLSVPFLFLCGGECSLLRRLGGSIGNCMDLSVYEYDELAASAQPLLRDLKAVRDHL